VVQNQVLRLLAKFQRGKSMGEGEKGSGGSLCGAVKISSLLWGWVSRFLDGRVGVNASLKKERDEQ